MTLHCKLSNVGMSAKAKDYKTAVNDRIYIQSSRRADDGLDGHGLKAAALRALDRACCTGRCTGASKNRIEVWLNRQGSGPHSVRPCAADRLTTSSPSSTSFTIV